MPGADNLVNFEVEGKGFIAGVDNGNPTSMESFKDNKRKAFNGLALVILQSGGMEKGEINIKATSEGLEGASIRIVGE